jgi:hypothetical protein
MARRYSDYERASGVQRSQQDYEALQAAHDEHERDAYAALADEMNDTDVPPWNEDDWDAIEVAAARRYAEKHGLRFPPGTGDYDRFYERSHA